MALGSAPWGTTHQLLGDLQGTGGALSSVCTLVSYQSIFEPVITELSPFFPPVVSTSISYSFCSWFIFYLAFLEALGSSSLSEKCPSDLLGICNQENCWLVLIVDQITRLPANKQKDETTFFHKLVSGILSTTGINF